jgi:hypothetical protein
VYDLSLADHHTFFVGHPEVLAHNFIFVAAAAPAITWTIGQIFTAVAVTTAASAIGAIAIIKHKQREQSRSGYGNPDPWQDPQKPDDEDEDKDKGKEHPHGIYRGEDAKYHHKNSYGTKSGPPRDGQRALDNSIRVKDSSSQRVAIEDEQFVVLRETSKGVYHGYVTTFAELSADIRQALYNGGFTTLAGKIIKK